MSITIENALVSNAPDYHDRFQMIEEIEIDNFRCYERIRIQGCKRFNLIVGDNGVGKTALLEALFLTLAGNPEVSLRLKTIRGFDINYSGNSQTIEEAIWRDYFFDYDWTRSINVNLIGSGAAARSMTLARGGESRLIPFQGFNINAGGNVAPLTFTWRNNSGQIYSSSPQVTPQGIQIAAPSEVLADFFYFAANQTVNSGENALRFSELSRNQDEKEFVDIFSSQYPWITNLNVEVSGGVPIVHATLKGQKRKIPVNLVSGGINRMLSIMLAIASRPEGVILIDEAEDGLYYQHKSSMWKVLLDLSRRTRNQLFITTHDEEWIDALIEAAADQVDDIALWRISRGDHQPIVQQFFGKTFKRGVETGGEMR